MRDTDDLGPLPGRDQLGEPFLFIADTIVTASDVARLLQAARLLSRIMASGCVLPADHAAYLELIKLPLLPASKHEPLDPASKSGETPHEPI